MNWRTALAFAACVLVLCAIHTGCRRIKAPVPAQAAQDPNKPTTSQSATSAAATGPACRDYTIRSGDTLRKIAIRECGRVGAIYTIQNLNPGLEERNLKIGQVIKIPLKKPKPPPRPRP